MNTSKEVEYLTTISKLSVQVRTLEQEVERLRKELQLEYLTALQIQDVEEYYGIDTTNLSKNLLRNLYKKMVEAGEKSQCQN